MRSVNIRLSGRPPKSDCYHAARMPTVTVIASAAAVAIVAAGWRLGFWSPAAYLLFATSCGAVLATAVRLVRAVWPWRGVVDAMLRAGVVVPLPFYHRTVR